MTDRSTQIEPTRLTAETQHRLQAELEDLTTRGRVEIAQAIETARALGDLSENGDYHAAKDSQGKMESRIRQLSALLKNVELVETGGGDGTVAAGGTVTLRYEGDDEDDVQRFFVGSIEEHHDGMSVVSPSAPLGLALLGHKAGETVEYKAPAGPLRVVIVKVGD